MSQSHLTSKEWCDLVFEGRNRDYGAYRIRQRTGKRYARALAVVLTLTLVLSVTYTAYAIYERYQVALALKDASKELAKLKYEDLKDGYEVKFQSTARMLPSRVITPGATNSAPVIVEDTPKETVIGFDGAVAFDADKEVIVTPISDTTGLHDEELPMAKQKIVPTEAVKQMPEFPGGLKAFMQWLNERIIYPSQTRKQGKSRIVTVSFIVDTDGYATDFEITDCFDPRIRRSIIAALKSLPKWTPGHDELGQPTPVKITVPVEFKGETKN